MLQNLVAGCDGDILICRDPMEERISTMGETSVLRQRIFAMTCSVISPLVDFPTPGKISGEL
jgi:hypothetical protein